jgi:signal transduction histidine kinase
MQSHEHVVTGGSGFLPHGFCYLWDPQLLWTHVGADFLIGFAYLTISVSLAWLVHRVRRDIPFSWAFVAFGLFIITCGLTHFMDIWTLWRPVYWTSAGVKIVTAVASVATAIAMPFTVPRAVATVRDAKLGRERELEQARAEALEQQNALLRRQAVELEEQQLEAQNLAVRLEETNAALQDALAEAVEARSHAEEADAAKSVFLRTMSHELRTPLNAIIGYQHLLEYGVTGPVNEEQVEQLRRIGHSANHLLGLIDEVLTLASAASVPPERHVSAVALSSLIHDVVIMAEPQAVLKGLQLSIDEIPDIVVATDAGRAAQILLNLIANAVKFTEHGAIRISAELTGDDVLVHVTDTGPGIPPEHFDDVFEPFWQLQQGTTRTYGGSGLGLTVSRELAHKLGGDIMLQSELGAGSTFTLRLPLRRTDEAG